MSQAIQKEFFEILAEFFKKATGTSAEKFADLDSFSVTLKNNIEKLKSRGEQAYSWGITALLDFYSRNEFPIFKFAKETGGMKLVLGGNSRFTKTP